MPISVITAFNRFLDDVVNLDPLVTSNARRSRNWLLGQISGFDQGEQSFPTLYPEVHIQFGAFARNTKTRPLDDIDLMIGLKAEGSTYLDCGSRLEISVPSTSEALSSLCFVGSNSLSSRRVVNKFVTALQNVPQYAAADVSRNQQAAVLHLKSQEWSFDIVPAFFTAPDESGIQYYLIPDGNGHWQRTDPRKDRDRVSAINQRNGGHVLNVIRIMKYWNQRATMPSMPSYLLESMMLDHYDSQFSTRSGYVDLNLSAAFLYVRDHVFHPVMDPKGIQGDINKLVQADRLKLWHRANLDHERANEARTHEDAGQMKNSIQSWTNIFGPNFPAYD